MVTETTNKLVLQGTTAYYENLVPDVANRLKSDELVFLHDILPGNCQYNCLKCFSESSDVYSGQLKERGLSSKHMDKNRLFHEAYENGVRSIIVPGAGEPLISQTEQCY